MSKDKHEVLGANGDTRAMRAGNEFPPGSNGDTLNQHPAAAQTTLTALDHDPNREGVTTENADDPVNKPKVERDLATTTPGPDPVDPPMPNRVLGATGGSLQQPTDEDRAKSRKLRQEGVKGDVGDAAATEPSKEERAKRTRKVLGGTKAKSGTKVAKQG